MGIEIKMDEESKNLIEKAERIRAAYHGGMTMYRAKAYSHYKKLQEDLSFDSFINEVKSVDIEGDPSCIHTEWSYRGETFLITKVKVLNGDMYNAEITIKYLFNEEEDAISI